VKIDKPMKPITSQYMKTMYLGAFKLSIFIRMVESDSTHRRELIY